MFISADLAGAEWFVTGFVAKEPSMIAVYKSGVSPHLVTGALMTGLTEAQVAAEAKIIKESTDPVWISEMRHQHLPELFKVPWLPRTMSVRQAAKKGNHGGNYREGYKTFALNNEMDESEAKRILELYRGKAYRGLNDWYKRIDAEVSKTRCLTNFWGRKIFFMGALDDDTFRAATSAIPQSTVVDIIDMALPKIMNDDREEFEPANLRAQVHDSLLTDYLSRNYKMMARFIHGQVEYLSPTIDYGEPFKLRVDVKVGFDWKDMTEIHTDVSEEELDEVLHKVANDYAAKRKLAA